MKRFKLPKVKVNGKDLYSLFNYILLILLTSLLFIDILISLPLTERVSEYVSYDLQTKNEQYWAQEYTLQLDTLDLQNKEKAIEQTESILLKRLNKLGVEKSTFSSETIEDVDYLKVDIQSTKDREFVDELIRNPYILEVVTRKADVDFEDQENPYNIYIGENYEPTGFNRTNFRNVYITKLKNSSGEYSYFALYKTWAWETGWKEFIQEHMGQNLGVSIDGFVTPIQIPTDINPVFALPLSVTDIEQANLISILYNSGTVPVTYTLTDQQETEVENIETDYVKLTEGILLATILIYGYLLFIDKTPKSTLVVSGLSTIITISSWITYLKITGAPIDIFILAIEIITMVIILRITTENRESHILVNVLVALIASLSAILGSGYVKLFAEDMLALIIIGNLAQIFSKYYINKTTKVFKI
jgi:hypothetical protein